MSKPQSTRIGATSSTLAFTRTFCKSEVIAETLQQLSARAEHAVMVGDREHDVVGAATHGISCVGVSWGYAEPGELEAAGACEVIHRPEDLLSAVRRVL